MGTLLHEQAPSLLDCLRSDPKIHCLGPTVAQDNFRRDEGDVQLRLLLLQSLLVGACLGAPCVVVFRGNYFQHHHAAPTYFASCCCWNPLQLHRLAYPATSDLRSPRLLECQPVEFPLRILEARGSDRLLNQRAYDLVFEELAMLGLCVSPRSSPLLSSSQWT